MSCLLTRTLLLFPVVLMATQQSQGQTRAEMPSPTATISLTKPQIDWAEFLARHDMTWDTLPLQWNEGAFLGNGQLGLMAYATLEDNRLDFHLGRVDVTDHRGAPDRKTSRGVRGASVLYDFCRLDIGRMLLKPAGKIVEGTMRVDLYNAELRGSVTTDRGILKFRALTAYDRNMHVIEVESTEVDSNGKPLPWAWVFKPGNPASPRAQCFPDAEPSKKYKTNPNPVISSSDGGGSSVQSLLAGGDYATAWRDVRSGTAGTLYVTTANEVPAAGKSLGVASADLDAATKAGVDGVIEGHREHWHAFYRRSFLSIPDPRLESFYWIQMYKLGSASRPDAPPLDNSGPWFRVNQWPGLWWNLNVQITYWPVYTANRLELSKNLITEIDTNFEGLFSTFKDKPKLGDFAWVLHNYYLQHRFEADWSGLAANFLPKAREVVKAYDKFISRDADGKLSLLPMESPEWEGFKTYPNSTYNLALLKWLLTTITEIGNRVPGSVSPDELKACRAMLENLSAFPTDEFGLRISADQSVRFSHRHYSHLLGLYPLFVLNPDSAADRELVIKSVKHWHHIENRKGLAGYSYTGGAALYAALGMGDEAHEMLTHFLTKLGGMSRLFDNTMYVEVGKNPVLETPHSAAGAASDLLLQSWGEKVRVFPALPTAWKDAAFHQLRAQGAFIVSASRAGAVTQWVAIKSLKGEPCTLKVPDWQGPLNSPRATPLPTPGEYRLTLAAGEELLLFPAGRTIDPVISPVAMPEADRNLYGLKKGRVFKPRYEWPEVPLPSSPSTQP